MTNLLDRIPFTLPDKGFREYKGFIYVDAGELVIEIEHALFGLFDHKMRVFRVELTALDRVDLEQGTFKDHLLIVPTTGAWVEEFPQARADYLDLLVGRRHRKRLRSLVRLIGLAAPF